MTYQYPGKTPRKKRHKRGGRPPRLSDMSRQAIDMEVQKLLDQNPSDHLWDVVDILAPNGVLSTEQLRFLVSYWTLRDAYVPRRVVDRLPFTHEEIREILSEYDLPVGDHPSLYALGPVGIELAKRRDLVPLTGYQAYPLRRVMHDVALNEIVLRLADFADQQGWSVEWRGTNDAALYNADHAHKILEPDLLLMLRKDEESRLFCIEYHNEDHRTRAERKIGKYEIVRISNEQLWQDQWETDTFPAVLAVFAKRIVGEGRFWLVEALSQFEQDAETRKVVKLLVQAHEQFQKTYLAEGAGRWYDFLVRRIAASIIVQDKVSLGPVMDRIFEWYEETLNSQSQ